MNSTTYIAKVLEDGHLSLPESARRHLKLKKGDEIEVQLRKAGTAFHLEDEFQELGRLSDEELQVLADYMLPREKQKRGNELLYKKQRGKLTEQETMELERLVLESEMAAMRKAKAQYVLLKRQEPKAIR